MPSKMDLAEKLLALQQALFPRSCSLCREALNPKQQIMCSGCIDDLPYNSSFCLRCSEPLVSTGICPACQKNPFAPERKQLSILFAKRIQTHYQAQELPKIFIPMPIHTLKMLYRGFNQSLIIAQFMSGKLADTEVKNSICTRKNFAKSQRFMSRKQRLKILATSFSINHRDEIQEKSLALIDDVFTTGSTANAATESVLNAGAKSVDLWCIAKTSWHNGSGSIKM